MMSPSVEFMYFVLSILLACQARGIVRALTDSLCIQNSGGYFFDFLVLLNPIFSSLSLH